MFDTFNNSLLITIASIVSIITFVKYGVGGWNWLHTFAQTKGGQAALNVITCIGVVITLAMVLFRR